jgi:biopolymer transport protein TolR
MAMIAGSSTRECAAINITPMIDVLLVLLIIFMAIAPQKTVGLDALVPVSHPDSPGVTPEDAVVLEIGANGAYRLNTIPVERLALGERLSAIYSRRANRVLFVKGALGLEFHTVADAIDIAHGAAVDRVALMPR